MALLDRDSSFRRSAIPQSGGQSDVRALVGAEITAKEGFRYPLLAETREGYQNLCRLLTKIKLREANGDQHKAAATVEDLAEHSPTAWFASPEATKVRSLRARQRNHRTMQRVADAESHRNLRPRNVYAELQRHHDLREESAAIRRRWSSRAASICRCSPPTASATRAPHERELMDVLTCMRHKTHDRRSRPPARQKLRAASQAGAKR